MPAVELPPFTEAHREAVRRMRFVTPNVAREGAWCFTDDVELVRVLVPGAGMNEAERLQHGADEHPRVASAVRYRRSSEPEKHEWELWVRHPDGVAFICDLVDERHA